MAGVPYCLVKIYTDEEARWAGAPLHEAIVHAVAKERSAARCIVMKGVAGCSENGEIASHRVLDLSHNMPITIEIILPTPELDALLGHIEPMVGNGIVTVRNADVLIHRSSGALIPRGLFVRDVMTSPAVSVTTETPLAEVVAVLVRSEFDGVPVVDKQGRSVGMVTQAGLIAKAGMQIKPQILAGFWRGEPVEPAVEAELFDSLTTGRTAVDVMTKSPPAVSPESPLSEAIKLMASDDLKRLAVVDSEKRLVGMIARVDVLRVASSGGKRRRVLRDYGVGIPGATTVGSIPLLQVPTVDPDTPALDLVDLIDREGQRVVVLDEDGGPQGIISDRDLLPLLGNKGIKKGRDLKAASLMHTDLPLVLESATIDEALDLMVDLRRKRLPVVDPQGRYRGMLSREELLRVLGPEAAAGSHPS